MEVLVANKRLANCLKIATVMEKIVTPVVTQHKTSVGALLVDPAV